MNEKDKADCLVELFKGQAERFKQTRSIEFKVNIALWSFIILAGYFILHEILPSLKFSFFIFGIGYIFIAILIVFFHYHFWMFPITRSQQTNDFFIRKYSFEIESLLKINIQEDPGSIPIINRFKDFSGRSRDWIFFEVGITAVLLIIIFLFALFLKV